MREVAILSEALKEVGFENILEIIEKISSSDLELDNFLNQKIQVLELNLGILINKKGRLDSIIKNPDLKIECKEIDIIIKKIKESLDKIYDDYSKEDLEELLKDSEKEVEEKKEKNNQAQISEYAESIRYKKEIKNKLRKINILEEILLEITNFRQKLNTIVDSGISPEKVVKKSETSERKNVLKQKNIGGKKIEKKEKTENKLVEIKIQEESDKNTQFYSNDLSEIKQYFEENKGNKDLLNKFLENNFSNFDNKLKIDFLFFVIEKNFYDKKVIDKLFSKIKINSLKQEEEKKWDILYKIINAEKLKIKKMERKEVSQLSSTGDKNQPPKKEKPVDSDKKGKVPKKTQKKPKRTIQIIRKRLKHETEKKLIIKKISIFGKKLEDDIENFPLEDFVLNFYIKYYNVEFSYEFFDKKENIIRTKKTKFAYSNKLKWLLGKIFSNEKLGLEFYDLLKQNNFFTKYEQYRFIENFPDINKSIEIWEENKSFGGAIFLYTKICDDNLEISSKQVDSFLEHLLNRITEILEKKELDKKDFSKIRRLKYFLGNKKVIDKTKNFEIFQELKSLFDKKEEKEKQIEKPENKLVEPEIFKNEKKEQVEDGGVKVIKPKDITLDVVENKEEKKLSEEILRDYNRYLAGKLRGRGSFGILEKIIKNIPVELFIKLIEKDLNNFFNKKDEYFDLIVEKLESGNVEDKIIEFKGQDFLDKLYESINDKKNRFIEKKKRGRKKQDKQQNSNFVQEKVPITRENFKNILNKSVGGEKEEAGLEKFLIPFNGESHNNSMLKRILPEANSKYSKIKEKFPGESLRFYHLHLYNLYEEIFDKNIQLSEEKILQLISHFKIEDIYNLFLDGKLGNTINIKKTIFFKMSDDYLSVKKEYFPLIQTLYHELFLKFSKKNSYNNYDSREIKVFKSKVKLLKKIKGLELENINGILDLEELLGKKIKIGNDVIKPKVVEEEKQVDIKIKKTPLKNKKFEKLTVEELIELKLNKRLKGPNSMSYIIKMLNGINDLEILEIFYIRDRVNFSTKKDKKYIDYFLAYYRAFERLGNIDSFLVQNALSYIERNIIRLGGEIERKNIKTIIKNEGIPNKTEILSATNLEELKEILKRDITEKEEHIKAYILKFIEFGAEEYVIKILKKFYKKIDKEFLLSLDNSILVKLLLKA